MIISGFLWLLYGSLWLSELQFVWMWHSQMPGRSRQDGVGVAPWIVGLGWLGWVGVNMYLGWLGGSFFVSVWLGGFGFSSGLGTGCHVDTSWKRCSDPSCTFKRVCLYLESISIPYQVLEFYIQKIVDTVSWVTQQLRYQYHLHWSI